ncbi:MAG: hypothetical protein LBU16_10850 [Treponema sp.]|jgi:hypothetical protein|nr:hypothetical protein [Treponema sp.]
MKRFVAGLVVLIACMGLSAYWAGAQESPIALRESSWPEQGRVTEMRALHDLRGGVYIPYIAEGAFRVLRAGAGGKLDVYAPKGFDRGPLGARSLKAISDGPERYVAFIGQSGGESIHLFGFGFWDDLSYCPLAETKAAVITDYSLAASKNGGVMVYALAGGLLRSFFTGIRGGAPRQSREISRADETVEAFEVRRERSQEITYGWYRVARKDYWEITLFSLNDAGNLVVERTGFRAAMPRLEYGVSPEGKAVFTIIAGSAVSVYHAEGLRFVRDAAFDAPLTVKRYSPALLTGGSVGLLIGETEDAEVLYGVSYERSGAPALQELFAAPSAEILELFSGGNNRISLVYRSKQTLGAALLRVDGGIIDDRLLPVSAGEAVLFRQSPWSNRLYAVSRAGSKELCVLSVLGFDGEAWRLTGEAQIPLFIPEELQTPVGSRDNDLLLMISPEALMLYEIESSRQQTLEMENYDRSAALNGVVYLAVSSKEGIDLYRIEE